MSKIDDLIKEKCPSGIRYKNLGSFCEIKTGAGITKKDIVDDGKYKIISGGFEPMGMCDKHNRPGNTVTIARAGSAGFVNYIEEEFYLNDKCFSIIPKSDDILNKFLYYSLSNIQEYIFSLKSSGTVPTVNTEKVSKIEIPIPPLEVQEEIVRILDKFGELEAELEARKSQYEFWRGKLINEEYQTYKLQDVLTIKNGKDYKHLEPGDIPVYGSGGIMTYVNKYAYDKPSVLIPRKGSLGNVFYVDKPFWNVDTIYYTEIDTTKIIPKYVYYYIQNKHLDRLNIAGGVPSMTQATLNRLDIPLPSLEEQQKIVNILDKFDKLVNDISEGLPAEIEARRKQYEYYRNKLLSFEEVSCE